MNDDFLRPGEFYGTKRELERRRARARAHIKAEPRYHQMWDDENVYVDAAGSIYAKSDVSNKFTMYVGQCLPGRT